jgi:hypothetical protein
MANTIKGSEGSLKVGNDNTDEVELAQVKSYSLTESADTAETTVMGGYDGTTNTSYKSFTATLKSWEGSCDIIYNHDDFSNALLTAGADIYLELYPQESDTTNKYSGDAVVTSFEITADTGDLVQATVNFQGNGALDRT